MRISKSRKRELKKMKEKIDKLETKIREYTDEMEKIKKMAHEAIKKRDEKEYMRLIHKAQEIRKSITVLQSVRLSMKEEYEKAYWQLTNQQNT